MASARPSPQPAPPQPPLWRTSLAAALRRIARAVAPLQVTPRASVSPSPVPVERTPQLPPGMHSAGNGATQAAQGSVVDPLERARAALREARQHMTALMDSDPPAAAPVPAPAPAGFELEPLRELLAELGDERRALLAEIAGMRTLLQETRAEISALRQALRERLAEVQALQQLPPAAPEPALAPPAPSLAELIAETGDAPETEANAGEAAAVADAPHEPRAETGTRAAAEIGPARQPDRAPFRDFGWRVRPEAALPDAMPAAIGAAEAHQTGPADPPSQPGEPSADAVAPAAADTSAAPSAAPVEPRISSAASATIDAEQSLPAAARIADFAPILPPDEPETPRWVEQGAAASEPEPTQADRAATSTPAAAPTPDDARGMKIVAEPEDGLRQAVPAFGGQGIEPAEGAAGMDGRALAQAQGSEVSADTIRLPAGSTRLVIGPVRSIGRLTALERRLVREPALAQVTLADFRRQLATIVVSARSPITFTALAPVLSDDERMPIAAAWQADGALLITLGKRTEEGA